MAHKTNPYPGINPHLNSHLQHETGWKGFHTHHIADIGRTIDPLLPEGYYTAAEESLQITAREGDAAPTRTIPDVMIYRAGGSRSSSAVSPQASAPTLSLPVLDEWEEEEYLSSIVIYHLESGTFPGKAVTRIELLSPGNKPTGAHHERYLLKRDATLKVGLRLVEIDYLHQSPPVLDRIPSYPDREAGAYPYTIVVSDPRPSLLKGMMDIYGFGVLDTLPVIHIPLDGDDTVLVNFGEIYNLTFNSQRLYSEILADNTREPQHFDAYSPDDQAKITAFMQTIQKS